MSGYVWNVTIDSLPLTNPFLTLLKLKLLSHLNLIRLLTLLILLTHTHKNNKLNKQPYFYFHC